MFHVLRPGYTIPQNPTSRTLPPTPQILGTWKIFEKFLTGGLLLDPMEEYVRNMKAYVENMKEYV